MTGSTPTKGLGSKSGGDFYGHRLKFGPFYGYRFIFFQLRLTKKLIINFSCFKELNINKPVFFVSLKQDELNFGGSIILQSAR